MGLLRAAYEQMDAVWKCLLWLAIWFNRLWYLEVVTNGHARAQFSVGRVYVRGRDPVGRDCREAINWYAWVAEGGQLSARFAIAWHYETGKRCRRDAAMYASSNSTWPCRPIPAPSSLARLCIDGKGVEAGPVEACARLNLAAAASMSEVL